MNTTTIPLSRTYKFGSKEISELEFTEVTGREMGEIKENMAFKDFYPIAAMLTGMPVKFIISLAKADIKKVIEHTVFLLADE